VAEYAATGETEAMLHGLERIRKRLGDDAWRRCADALRAGDHTTAVRILLRYYDKAYAHHQAQQPREAVRHIVLERDDPATVARRLAADEDSLAG
jgi:tRNA 2-selenouridine synthase